MYIEPKKHRCRHCEHTFHRLYDFERHQRTHTQERPYACEECPSKFTRSDHLTEHVRALHRKEFSYKCKQCPESFKTYSNHWYHERSVHQTGLYKHKRCSKSVIRYSNIRYHRQNCTVNLVHGDSALDFNENECFVSKDGNEDKKDKDNWNQSTPEKLYASTDSDHDRKSKAEKLKQGHYLSASVDFLPSRYSSQDRESRAMILKENIGSSASAQLLFWRSFNQETENKPVPTKNYFPALAKTPPSIHSNQNSESRVVTSKKEQGLVMSINSILCNGPESETESKAMPTKEICVPNSILSPLYRALN